MSKLRPTLKDAAASTPTMCGGTAYLLIYRAVQDADGLIHGHLHDRQGRHCAIGCYFERHAQTALPYSLIDEVAAVNDSLPHASVQQRKREVVRWLRWQLAALGVPGFSRWRRKAATA